MTAQDAILFLCEEKQVQKDEGGKLKMTIAYRIKWLSQNVEEHNIERWLKAVLSHPEFKFVAQGFLPSLALMEEVCRPSRESLELEAERQFSLVLRNISRYEHLETSNHRLVAGLTACGGWLALCDSLDTDIPFRRKEFVRAYCNSTRALTEPVIWHGLSHHERQPLCIDSADTVRLEHKPDNVTMLIGDLADKMVI
jgi:hypothetical protein